MMKLLYFFDYLYLRRELGDRQVVMFATATNIIISVHPQETKTLARAICTHIDLTSFAVVLQIGCVCIAQLYIIGHKQE
jgi:hypothetical protein